MPSVTIEGNPVPKARFRTNRRGGGWTPSEAAEEYVAFHFLPYRHRYVDGQEIMVYCEFHCHVRNPVHLPDGDNLFKLVADAMQRAYVVKNDRQIRKHIVEVKEVGAGQQRTIVWFGTREEAEL